MIGLVWIGGVQLNTLVAHMRTSPPPDQTSNMDMNNQSVSHKTRRHARLNGSLGSNEYCSSHTIKRGESEGKQQEEKVDMVPHTQPQ